MVVAGNDGCPPIDPLDGQVLRFDIDRALRFVQAKKFRRRRRFWLRPRGFPLQPPGKRPQSVALTLTVEVQQAVVRDPRAKPGSFRARSARSITGANTV
jgi:hypothetical protein